MIFVGQHFCRVSENVPLPVPDAPSECALASCGAAPGKTLVVTVGHGREYVIQALRRLAADLDPRGRRGTSSYRRWQIPVLLCRSQTGGAGGRRQFEPSLPGNLRAPSARLAFALRRLYTCWQISTAETAAKRFIHWCSSGSRKKMDNQVTGCQGPDGTGTGSAHRQEHSRAVKHSALLIERAGFN